MRTRPIRRLIAVVTAAGGFSTLGLHAGHTAFLLQRNQLSGQPTASVVGRVVDAATRVPIADVVVALTPYGGPQPPRVLTDADGRFAFWSVRAADYRLTATAPGYLEGGYRQGHPLGAVTRLVMNANERVSSIEIRLWRLGAIHGRVLDEDGEPLTGVTVRAFRLHDDTLADRPIGGVLTDDRGQYAISALAPGSYLVAAVFSTVSTPASSEGSARRPAPSGRAPSAPPVIRIGDSVVRASSVGTTVGLLPRGAAVAVRPTVYYPVASSPHEAIPLAIGPGTSLNGIDLVVPAVPAFRLSGRVVGAALPATIRLRRSDAADPLIDEHGLGSWPVDVAQTDTDASGAFTFAGVPAGSYVVTLEQARTGRAATDQPAAWARVGVTVAATDVADLVVAASPGLRVSGRIQLADGDSVSSMPARMPVFLNSPGRSTVSAVVSDGATFAAGNLLPGPYTFDVNASPGWSVGWLEIDGRRVTNRAIDLGRDAQNVVLLITRRLGRVTGTLGGDVTARPVRVLLFPAASAEWTSTAHEHSGFRAALPDMDGSFSIASLPPGDYFAVAVPDDQFDPRWRRVALQVLSSIAVRLTVQPSATTRVDVPVYRRSR